MPVFGDPVTRGSSRSERVANAQLVRNDNRRVEAVAYLEKEKGRNSNGVSTLCLFYNATGDIMYKTKDQHSYEGRLWDSYPQEVQNGQWAAFLHVGKTSPATASMAYVVYSANGNNGEGLCKSLIGWETPHNVASGTHAFCEVYEQGQDINNDEISGKIRDAGVTYESDTVKGISIAANIGTGLSPWFEATFNYKDAY